MRIHIDVRLTEEQHNSLYAALEENLKRIRMNIQDCMELVQGPEDTVSRKAVDYWEKREKAALETLQIFRENSIPEEGGEREKV